MVADTVSCAIGAFESTGVTELTGIVEATALAACPEQHVVRIGRAVHNIPQNKRVPAVAVWAAEKVVRCEWWWCHSRGRVSFGTAVIVAADP